jgi:transcriptional regulator with XRE-family HTH domain
MNLSELKKELLRNKKFRKEYFSKDTAFEIGMRILEVRILRKLTQKQLANKIGTKQPSIARIENGSYLPNISFLEKIAKALKTDLILPQFKILEKSNDSHFASSSKIKITKNPNTLEINN